MSGPAKVQSSEAIEAVRLALISFIDHVGDSLTELSAEMRRVQEWLERDRPSFWKNQTRLAMDKVHEAQQALQRCLMFPVANERPSCYEERAELKKAMSKPATLMGVSDWLRCVAFDAGRHFVDNFQSDGLSRIRKKPRGT